MDASAPAPLSAPPPRRRAAAVSGGYNEAAMFRKLRCEYVAPKGKKRAPARRAKRDDGGDDDGPEDDAPAAESEDDEPGTSRPSAKKMRGGEASLLSVNAAAAAAANEAAALPWEPSQAGLEYLDPPADREEDDDAAEAKEKMRADVLTLRTTFEFFQLYHFVLTFREALRLPRVEASEFETWVARPAEHPRLEECVLRLLEGRREAKGAPAVPGGVSVDAAATARLALRGADGEPDLLVGDNDDPLNGSGVLRTPDVALRCRCLVQLAERKLLLSEALHEAAPWSVDGEVDPRAEVLGTDAEGCRYRLGGDGLPRLYREQPPLDNDEPKRSNVASERDLKYAAAQQAAQAAYAAQAAAGDDDDELPEPEPVEEMEVEAGGWDCDAWDPPRPQRWSMVCGSLVELRDFVKSLKARAKVLPKNSHARRDEAWLLDALQLIMPEFEQKEAERLEREERQRERNKKQAEAEAKRLALAALPRRTSSRAAEIQRKKEEDEALAAIAAAERAAEDARKAEERKVTRAKRMAQRIALEEAAAAEARLAAARGEVLLSDDAPGHYPGAAMEPVYAADAAEPAEAEAAGVAPAPAAAPVEPEVAHETATKAEVTPVPMEAAPGLAEAVAPLQAEPEVAYGTATKAEVTPVPMEAAPGLAEAVAPLLAEPEVAPSAPADGVAAPFAL